MGIPVIQLNKSSKLYASHGGQRNALNCKGIKLIKDGNYMACTAAVLCGVSIGAGAFCFCFGVIVVSAARGASELAESPSLGSVSLSFSISFEGI